MIGIQMEDSDNDGDTDSTSEDEEIFQTESQFYLLSDIDSLDAGPTVQRSISNQLSAAKKFFLQKLCIHFAVWYTIYILVGVVYNYAVTNPQDQEIIQAVARGLEKIALTSPMTTALGLWTSCAILRLRSIRDSMPGVNQMVLTFILSLKLDLESNGRSSDPHRLIEKYSRLALLMWVAAFRNVSKVLRKKYPTLKSMQEDGLITQKEVNRLPEYPDQSKLHLYVFYMMVRFIKRCERKNYLRSPAEMKLNIDQLMTLKRSLIDVIKNTKEYDTPQIIVLFSKVTLHAYGLVILFSHLYIADKDKTAQAQKASLIMAHYLPNSSAISYFLYYVWTQVTIIVGDPFGEHEANINILKVLEERKQEAAGLGIIYGKATLKDMQGLMLSSITHGDKDNEGQLRKRKLRQSQRST